MNSIITNSEVAEYWNEHIHDLNIVTHPVGTEGFFNELDTYRYTKLRYLPETVDFSAYRGWKFLEVGCGVGIDLVRFAKAGAIVTGIDLSRTAIDLARKNFKRQFLDADLMVMDGEQMKFTDDSFDMVYAHGVLQYTPNPQKMVAEIHRVLKPEGQAIIMVYNQLSWLNFLSKMTNVPLEHQDAPVLKKYSIEEFRNLLGDFSKIRIIPERFPVKTELHHGVKAKLYNDIFVSVFNLAPKAFVRPFGWHLIAIVVK